MQHPQEQQKRAQQRKVTTPSAANKNRPKSSFISWILNDNPNNKSSLSTVSAANTHSIENSKFSHDDNNHYMKVKLQMPDDLDAKSYANTEYAYKRNTDSVTKKDKSTMVVPEANASFQQVQIPDRHQSHLYTPFHDNEERGETTTLFDYKHRSYYTSQLSPEINVIDVTSNSSTALTRSATWQPSSSSSSSQLSWSPSQLLLQSSPPPPVPPHSYLAPCAGTAENMIPARRTSRNYSEDPEIQAKLNAVLNSEKATYLSHMLNNNNLSNTNMHRRSTTPRS